MPSITKLLHYLPYLRYFSNFKNILMNSEDFYMLDVCVCVCHGPYPDCMVLAAGDHSASGSFEHSDGLLVGTLH